MPAEAAYFDSAYLFKLYWNERGSNEVRAFAAGCSQLACAAHGRAEVAAAAHRKLREGMAQPHQIHAVFGQFKADGDAGGILFLPLTEEIIDRVEKMFRDLMAPVFLRAGDALHLACAAQNGYSSIYSNDNRLLEAAPLFGLKGIVLPAA
jgi:predicted nucleic acid-binding protein